MQCRITPTGRAPHLRRAPWCQMYREAHFTGFQPVGGYLDSIKPLESRWSDLFLDQPTGQPTERENLGTVIDRINRRFGVDTGSYGPVKPHYGFSRGGSIMVFSIASYSVRTNITSFHLLAWVELLAHFRLHSNTQYSERLLFCRLRQASLWLMRPSLKNLEHH